MKLRADAILFAAAVFACSAPDKWYAIEAPTLQDCQRKEAEIRKQIGSHQTQCEPVGPHQHIKPEVWEAIKTWHVKWGCE